MPRRSSWAPIESTAKQGRTCTSVPRRITGTVSFRFTPLGLTSGWQIDDVYVDPYCSR